MAKDSQQKYHKLEVGYYGVSFISLVKKNRDWGHSGLRQAGLIGETCVH